MDFSVLHQKLPEGCKTRNPNHHENRAVIGGLCGDRTHDKRIKRAIVFTKLLISLNCLICFKTV